MTQIPAADQILAAGIPASSADMGRIRNERLALPIFKYFLVVGSLLTALLLYANGTMAPVSSPISVTQTMGVPSAAAYPH